MSNMTKAMKAVRNGPEAKKLKVKGHHWNFKKAKREKIDRTKGTGVIKGRISHAVRWVDDDQIDYVIEYTGYDAKGQPKKPKVDIKIKEGRWSKLSAKAAGAVATYFSGGDVKVGKSTDAVAKEVFKHVHGGWRSVSKGLVAVIATEFAKLVYPPTRANT